MLWGLIAAPTSGLLLPRVWMVAGRSYPFSELLQSPACWRLESLAVPAPGDNSLNSNLARGNCSK